MFPMILFIIAPGQVSKHANRNTRKRVENPGKNHVCLWGCTPILPRTNETNTLPAPEVAMGSAAGCHAFPALELCQLLTGDEVATGEAFVESHT